MRGLRSIQGELDVSDTRQAQSAGCATALQDAPRFTVSSPKRLTRFYVNLTDIIVT